MTEKLYKYRSFNIRTLRLITEAEIFYSEPSGFNDPMDCDPTIEIDVDRESLEKLYYRMLRQTRDHQSALNVLKELRYHSTEYGDFRTDKDVEAYLSQMVADGIKRALDEELGSRGVLSLSKTWSSPLMWSHYADEHRGICLEYDTTDQEHANLNQVSYNAPRAIKTSDLVRWKAKDDPKSKERVLQTYFYAKSSEWRYEREWRDLSSKSGRHDLPFRLSAIHFGMRCDRAVITSIVKLLNEEHHIRLYSIYPKKDSFKLKRGLIDRDEFEAGAIREPSFLIFKDIVWGDEDDAGIIPDQDDIRDI